MTREEILLVYEGGPDAVVALVEGILATTRALEERVKSLEDQLAQNSRNSGKPPSSDGYTKPEPKSLRKPSGRKPGGQKGHPGHRLEMAEKPDHTETHEVQQCQACGKSLKRTEPIGHERRQVFDLPPLKIEVTEHVAEIKTCVCGCENRGSFPEHVTQPTQYGPGVRSLEVYLSQYQLLPYERTQELFQDLFGHSLSQGSLVNTNNVCYSALEPVENTIREALIQSPQVHFDETGCRIEGRLHWLHVASTSRLTFYGAHAKRGSVAMDDFNILPRFEGTAVHDHFNSYFQYKQCLHSLCNVHHLRELAFIHERFGQEWAKEMADFLLKIKELVDERRQKTPNLTRKELKKIERDYQKIVQEGFAANPELPRDEETNKRGPKRKTKPQKLLRRLDTHRKETLAFMYDFSVPFDNNQGERDVRMTKVKQKVSGTFRSQQGAKTFCRIRGYISTMKKQSVNILQALKSVFSGAPLLPALE